MVLIPASLAIDYAPESGAKTDVYFTERQWKTGKLSTENGGKVSSEIIGKL